MVLTIVVMALAIIRYNITIPKLYLLLVFCHTRKQSYHNKKCCIISSNVLIAHTEHRAFYFPVFLLPGVFAYSVGLYRAVSAMIHC